MQLLIFFLILSGLVLIHEWGHYISAKIFGVRVEEFGIGIPPRAKKLFVRKGTLFTLNWLPIGGFVRLFGEEFQEGDDISKKLTDRFFDKPIWQRAIVMVAGVVMNFALGVLIFGGIYSYLGIPTQTEEVRVTEVMKGSPAESVGIVAGDIIKKVEYEKTESIFSKTDDLVKFIADHKGKEVKIVFNRDGSEMTKSVVPRVEPPVGEGALGVGLSNTIMKHYPWYEMPFRGMVVGINEAIAWGKQILTGLGDMAMSVLTGKGVPREVSGPIGIYQVSSEVTKFGWIATLQFIAILSINLAILNILPLPALDGGRIVFLGVEMLIGKRLKNRIEGYVHAAGMYALLLLMALITFRDVAKIFKW